MLCVYLNCYNLSNNLNHRLILPLFVLTVSSQLWVFGILKFNLIEITT